jgi:hypothetical protein
MPRCEAAPQPADEQAREDLEAERKRDGVQVELAVVAVGA